MENFTNMPDPVEAIPRGDGLTDLNLRRCITERAVRDQEGPEQVTWDAEEVHLVGHYDEDFARECFDELWELGRRRAMSDTERIEDAEGGIDEVRDAVARLAEEAGAGALTMEDVLEAIAELGEIVAGGEM